MKSAWKVFINAARETPDLFFAPILGMLNGKKSAIEHRENDSKPTVVHVIKYARGKAFRSAVGKSRLKGRNRRRSRSETPTTNDQDNPRLRKTI